MPSNPLYLFIHPLLGSITVLLILTAYALKAGGRRYQGWHYLAGLGAFTVMTIAVSLAVWALQQREGELGFFPELSPVFNIHYFVALSLIFGMVLQTIFGVMMWAWKFMIPILRIWHWRLSQLMLVLILALTLMGVPTAYGLMEGRLILRILLIMLTTVFLLGSGLLILSLEQRSLHGSRVSKIPFLKNLLNPAHQAPDDEFQIKFNPDDKTGRVHESQNLLNAALKAGIPHTHVCGGNARCSTCRVVVLRGVENCLPRNSREQALADRLQFSPRVRLACQTNIMGDVTIRRLVIDQHDIDLASQLVRGARPRAVGHEIDAAIMFTDIRGFTSFAENQMPYDVIHALNRCYERMGDVVEVHKGQVNNYMGDGLLALFPEDDFRTASQRAVIAGQEILAEIENLKSYFKFNYDAELGIRVGVHYGTLVLGDIGTTEFRHQAAIGDAVNLASRIEEFNKDTGTNFLISENVKARLMDGAVSLGASHSFMPKGKSVSVQVHEVLLDI